MRYESIADIYTANEKIRASLSALAGSVTPDEASSLAEGEKWTPEHLIEHVSMVTGGVSQICSRLVEKAKKRGDKSDGRFELSPKIAEQAAQNATTKLEAPDMVKPGGGISIAESLQRLDAATAAFASLRDGLETLDVSQETFPHPYFGPMNAAEWLLLAGFHEGRHAKQLGAMLTNIRQ